MKRKKKKVFLKQYVRMNSAAGRVRISPGVVEEFNKLYNSMVKNIDALMERIEQ